MGIWLDGWAGDHAGKIHGRQPNRLLVALTHTDGTFPIGLIQKIDDHGLPDYPGVYVACLTPGARDATATAVDNVSGYVWSIEVAEVDYGTGKTPWQTDTHLFTVMLLAPGGHQTATITTALINDGVRRIDRSHPHHRSPPHFGGRPV